MRLSPLPESKAAEPRYPARRVLLPTWLGRAVLGAAAALAMALAGCEGSPLDPEPVPPPGMGPMPTAPFVCGESPPETGNTITLVDYNDGWLCGEQAAWAAIEVSAAGPYRVTIVGGEGVAISLFNPAGEHVAQLDDEHLELVVELTVGRWTVAALPDDPETDPTGWFEITVGPVTE